MTYVAGFQWGAQHEADIDVAGSAGGHTGLVETVVALRYLETDVHRAKQYCIGFGEHCDKALVRWDCGTVVVHLGGRTGQEHHIATGSFGLEEDLSDHIADRKAKVDYTTTEKRCSCRIPVAGQGFQ